MKFYWLTLKQTIDEFLDDDALRHSAAISYYSIFSLAPLLVICIAGAVLGEDAVRGQLDDQLKSSLGASGAFAVQDMVANARKPETNFWVSMAGIVMLLIGAGGLFGQLQASLNAIWGVKSKPGRGLGGMIRNRFLSFSMVLGTGFLLLISMILSVILQAMSKWIGNLGPIPPQVLDALSAGVSFGVITVLFAAIFKILPDARVRWAHVWLGALVTAALFVVGKTGIAWYLGREATSSSYGAAGSLALVLLWVYYSSIILLFGAEFTQVWAKRKGHQIEPSKNAVSAEA
jgi:membrane protein